MPMPSNEARRNLLPNELIESFWDVLWLGIQPFLGFSVQSRKVVQGQLLLVENLIATGRTDRELLGRPVARYSAVFVFYHRVS